MNKTRFDKLLADLRDNHEEEFANDLAIVLHKANMWDKYQNEERLDQSRLEALEITHDFKEELALEEMWAWCHDLDPEATRANEFKAHKDASGATYTGYDEEDIPGQARKGEN